MLDIPAYLQSKGINFKWANSTNIHMACWYHGEDEKDRGRLYINVDPNHEPVGLFRCFVCEERGAFNKIRKHFGDAPLANVSGRKTEEELPDEQQLAILEAATEFYHIGLTENEEAFRYLRYERGLTIETITKFRLGWSSGGLLTHLKKKGFDTDEIKKTGLVDRFGQDVLQGYITIPYLLMGQPVQIRGKDPKAKYYTISGDKARMFNKDALVEAETVVICEGEFDAMTLDQLGFKVVGLPGAGQFNEHWAEAFEDVRRVYVCMDNDRAGRAGAEKIGTMLGQKVRIVEMPEGSDINDWVAKEGKGREDFDALFARAVGGLIVTVDQAFERWLEIEGNPDLVGIRWNVPTIDEQMRHGLLPGQVVTLIAKTNAGKTLMSLNLFHRMSIINEDLKILFVSLEQTRNEWYERARRIYSFYDPWAENNDVLDYWRNRLVLVDKNRLSEDELLGAIEQYEYEWGCLPDFVCIDYLGYYARGFKGEAYERTTSAVMGLKHVAKAKQLIVFCPHQVNRTGNFGKELAADMAKESGAVEETSDMMMAIWNPDQQPGKTMQDQSGEVHLKILKSRDGPVGQEVVFQFCPRTLALVPVGDPLMSRAMKERSYAAVGDDWETVIYRLRSGDEQFDVSREVVNRYLKEQRRPDGMGGQDHTGRGGRPQNILSLQQPDRGDPVSDPHASEQGEEAPW